MWPTATFSRHTTPRSFGARTTAPTATGSRSSACTHLTFAIKRSSVYLDCVEANRSNGGNACVNSREEPR